MSWDDVILFTNYFEVKKIEALLSAPSQSRPVY